MLDQAIAMPVAKRRPGDTISLLVGAYALLAIAAVAVIDAIWGLFVVADYSWISDTISDLAAGDSSRIVDFAIKGFSIAVGLVGLALWRWNLGRLTGHSWRYWVGCAIACALAPVIYFIAGYDGYSGKPMGEMTIHLYLVYALGLGFPLMAWLTEPAFEAVSRRWRNLSLGLAVIWVLTAPYFMFMGTGWDGLYERGLALMLLVWFGVAGWNLVRQGRGLL